MKKIGLCKHCCSRILSKGKCKINVVDSSGCYICRGAIEEFLNKFNKSVKDTCLKNAKRFSLSTHIPKEYFIREEDVIDICPVESIKSWLNRQISQSIAERYGLRYDPINGDVRIDITFPESKTAEKRMPIYIFGKYKKYRGDISQKRWNREKFPSVEKYVGDAVISVLGGDKYYMHASGREDVDALNTAGRAFVLEIHNPDIFYPSNEELKKIEKKVYENSNGGVEIQLFGRVKQSFVTLVSDSHFDKTYKAYLSTTLSKGEQESIKKKLEGNVIDQKTPIRVIRRRADLLRRRKVYSIIFGEDDEGQYAIIKAEAGTYIKELISGDNGRTKPSFSSIIGREILCKKLIVTDINDIFINEVLPHATVD